MKIQKAIAVETVLGVIELNKALTEGWRVVMTEGNKLTILVILEKDENS